MKSTTIVDLNLNLKEFNDLETHVINHIEQRGEILEMAGITAKQFVNARFIVKVEMQVEDGTE